MQLTERQEQVLLDATRFFEAWSLYAALGVPWRRGYLLQGPPGTGKSSFISLVAGSTNAPIYLLSLRDAQLNDALLLKAVNSVPSKCLLVLEDIDSVAVPADAEHHSAAVRFLGAPPAGGGGGSSCSLSGLLNALDGIAASEGRLLMMTANRPESLPEALVRPGRIDEAVPFDHLTGPEVDAMTMRFLTASGEGGRQTPYSMDSVVNVTPRMSPAVLQHRLLERVVYKHGT
jgi:mitochondrial chaperone BCS1